MVSWKKAAKLPSKHHRKSNRRTWRLKKWLCTKRLSKLRRRIPFTRKQTPKICFKLYVRTAENGKQATASTTITHSFHDTGHKKKPFEIISSMKFYANRETFFSPSPKSNSTWWKPSPVFHLESSLAGIFAASKSNEPQCWPDFPPVFHTTTFPIEFFPSLAPFTS